MNTTYLINVTADDIRDGQRSHIKFCPIALAVTRAVGTPVAWVWAGGATRTTNQTFYRPTVKDVDACRAFVINFDNGLAVDPFQFTLVQMP